MLDLEKEPGITLNEVPRLPKVRAGRPKVLAPSTIWRWATKGVSRNGKAVILDTTYLPGTGRVTTAGAIDRFIAALNGSDDNAAGQGVRVEPKPHAPAGGSSKFLDAIGIA